MEAFAGISESLVQSYQALDERARHVEEELAGANAELARKVAELATVNAHLEAVLRSIPTGVVVRGSDGGILRANRAAAAILELGALPQGEEREQLVQRNTPEGAPQTVAIRRSRIRAAKGAPSGFVEILDDRTELVRMTERLHALDKMAALGTMGGGIAHEIRNPLNAVKGFAELLERALATGDPKLARWARCIVAGASEADDIIASLLAFASPERLREEPIEAAPLLADATRLAQADASAARCQVELVAEAPPFLGDRIKLRQALRNLIVNSAQAMPQGGRIEVAALGSAAEVLLRVRDSGPGIPRELAARVLDPFFTTRPEGTGLGLALVASIARLHGGCVAIRTAPPPLSGAEVTLHFPFQPPHAR
jgi:signal transduction histidine kinase